MNWDTAQLMKLFTEGDAGHLLLDGKWGLEKEALRISPTGELALTPHPAAFGDKLEHPHITVDFSESQIELITPALDTIEETYRFLNDLQLFVEESLVDELLWPLSMPGTLPSEDRIPLAHYGSSQDGEEKEIYRSGLALRYGKKMQMISGIHYNFSFGDRFWEFLHGRLGKNTEQRVFSDQVYLNVVKNFLGYRWLLIYLFGASPLGTDEYMNAFLKKNACLCGKAGCMRTFDSPVQYATSLRMSRFGYNNSFQNQLQISYNSLEEYISNLRQALATPVEAYSQLGIHRNGRQVQLNDNLLQSENEYYAPVRFKQGANIGKIMLDALEQKGIEYLEFRTFDLNPFVKTGISLEQLHFIHLFILFCCFEKSSELATSDLDRFNDNAQLTAVFGRSEQLRLTNHQGEKISIELWGKQIFNKLTRLAEILDQTNDSNTFQNSVKAHYKKLEAIDQLPSSAIVKTVGSGNGNFEGFGLERALLNRELYRLKQIKAS